METIGLQENARPLPGTIEHYWFENERVGLARTLFHRIRIPFEPFDSGLDHVPQPERTERLQSGGLATTGQEPMSTTVAVPVRVAPTSRRLCVVRIFNVPVIAPTDAWGSVAHWVFGFVR